MSSIHRYLKSLHVYELTEVNTGLRSSSGLRRIVLILLLLGIDLAAVGVVVKQGDWRDFAAAHQPSRGDGRAELHDTSDKERVDEAY